MLSQYLQRLGLWRTNGLQALQHPMCELRTAPVLITHTHTVGRRGTGWVCVSLCLRDAELCVSWWKHSQLLTQDLQRGLQQIITGAQTPEPHNTCPNPSASSCLDATFILGAYIILRFSLLYITHTAFTVFIFLLFNLYFWIPK